MGIRGCVDRLGRARDARVRPLGVDRCGLRLRVETPEHDREVRLEFACDARTPDELHVQMNRLVSQGGR